MQIVIFGVLCLWQAASAEPAQEYEAVIRGDVGNGPPTLYTLTPEQTREVLRSYEPGGGMAGMHVRELIPRPNPEQGPQISTAPKKSDESVSKQQVVDPKRSQGTEYVGVLVDTSPVRQQAQAQASGPHSRPPAQPLPFFAPPPADVLPSRRPQNPFLPAQEPQPPLYPPFRPPPRPQRPPRRPYAPTPYTPQEYPGEMFKLEAYLTKDGQIVNGRLMSLHDMVHGRPHVGGHQYITSNPSGVTLNRPPQYLGAIPYNPYSPPAPRPSPAYAPWQQSPPIFDPRLPQNPQQGQLSREQLNKIVNNIVKSSIGPKGEQVSSQLVEDIVNFLSEEVLTELAEALMKDNRQAGPSKVNAAIDPNSQALTYLQQVINEQINEKVKPILDQVSVPE